MDQMMSLRNLMEDKQLNFNQPLLSVRRFSSTASDTKEKTKAEPNIPPLPVYKSELKSGPVRNPGTVPFVWEHTPGKPKNETKTKSQLSVRPDPPGPKLPPGRVPDTTKQEPPVAVNASSARNTQIQEEEEEDDEAMFRDAIDRFSRSESFYMNCSISGVSGFEGSEFESSGAFSTDPQARDFMMDRFLPAAKAMASETPPHPVRKQTVVLERPRETKIPTNGYRQNRLVQTQYVQMAESEDEYDDDDDEYDRSEYSSLRGCGLLPRLCFRGPFNLLNSVPGMRMQDPPPASSVRRRRNSSTGNEPSRAVHMKEKATNFEANESEPRRRSRGSFQELLVDDSGSAGSASPVIEKTLYIDSVHKIKTPYSSSSSLDVKGIRNYSGEIIDDASVKSAETNTRKSNVADERTILRPGSMESVDTCSLNSSGRSICEVKMVLNCSRFNQERIQEAKKLTGSRIAYDKKFDLESQFPLKPSNRGSYDGLTGNTIREASTEEPYSEKSDSDRKQHEKLSQEGGTGRRLTEAGSQESFNGCAQDSLDTKTATFAENGNINSKDQNFKRVTDEDISKGCRSRMSFAPPPPKSPSESWLRRALPASSRNSPSSRSALAMRINAMSMATSPNTNHQRQQFSEELLPSISEV